MVLKRIVSAAVAVSIAAGIAVLPAGAAYKEKSFFDSVIRYISFDEDTSDFKGESVNAADVEIAEGKYGNAGVFNGTSSNINLGKIAVPQGQSFTVGYWIKANENTDSVVVGNKDWESGANTGWTTGIYKNAIKANTGYGSSDTEKRADTATYALNSSEWTYFTAVFDMNSKGTSTVTSYINGEEYSRKRVVAGNLESGLDTIIGMDSAAAKRFYSGMLDEFMLCSKALTPAEIKYAMNICENGDTFSSKYNETAESGFFELAEVSGMMILGEQEQLPVVYQGDGVDASNAVYSSSDESVASVSESGMVTALSMGSTVISVTYNNGTISYSGKYELTVTGKSYRMAERSDKAVNPSGDGWSFMYAPKGTDEFSLMTSYTESGDIWRKGTTGNDQYVRLNGTGYGHHPGASDDVIIKWTAPETGYINIKGNITAVAYSSTNKDGVNLTVTKNNDSKSQIDKINVSFDNDFQSGGKNIDKNVAVEMGDEIYFRIDNDVNNSADGFNFDPTITYIKEEAGISLKKDSAVLKVGDEESVPVSVTGDVVTSAISYESVNTAVADVDALGKITAKQLGETIIKVIYDNNGVKYSGSYIVKVVGEQYRMTERNDKNGNPSSDGWGFVYAPIGTNQYTNFEKHSETSDEWSTDTEGYTRIGGKGTNCHPGEKNDVAVTWTAPADGYINLGGHFENTNASTSDGVKLTVLNGENTVMSVITKNDGGIDLDKTIPVVQGDKIYFRFNCVSSNGADHFMFDPVITYTNGTIETRADRYMIKADSQMDIKIDTDNVTAASADESIAAVSYSGGLKITGVSDGETKVLLSHGDNTKIINVSVTSEVQPYVFSFNGAKETNSGAVCRIFTHLNTGSSKTPISTLSFDVVFDNNIAEMLDYKGNPMAAANESGVYTVNSAPARVMSSNNKYDADSTKVNAFYLRIKDENATELPIRITAPVINGVAMDEELCTVRNRSLTIHTNPNEDKNGDGLISVGDIAKAAAEGNDSAYLKGIAEKSGFYPVKRVFVVGIDGAGNSVDPENAWYQYSNADGTPSSNEVKFSAIGGKPEEKRWTVYEDTILKDAAYTFDALPCNPSMSAPNWTSILHGYNYYDAPFDTDGVVQRIDNDDSGNKYFPEDDSSWQSFMKIAREQMPNRNLMSNSNWTSIDMGIIEQSIGVWSVPYSSRFAYDGRDTHITDGIVSQIENGDTKNMSVMFVHFDEMDHIGHDTKNGFYTDNYYKEAHENKDNQIKKIYEAIYNNDEIKDDTVLIVTTDHGGQNHYHGGTEPSELYSFVTINGPVVNSGYSWKGDVEDEIQKKDDMTRSQTRDVPSIVAKSLGLTPDSDWRGGLKRASGAFLEQKEMIKKNRDIETVEYSETGVSVRNLKNKVTAMDITLSYTGDTAPELIAAENSEVLLKEVDAENKTVHMILYNSDGFGMNSLVSDSPVEVENVMLATDSGKEIYADIKPDDKAEITSVTNENNEEVTISDITLNERIKIKLSSGDEKKSTAVVIAAYDGKGVLAGLTVNNDVSKDTGMTEITADNPSYGKEDIKSVKVMWLNNLSGIMPLAQANEIK